VNPTPTGHRVQNPFFGRGPELNELEWCGRMRMAVAWDSVSAY